MRRWFRETGPGEWGERPRERVTVMPPENRGDKSECPDRLITLLPTPGAHGPEGTVRPLRLRGLPKRAGADAFLMSRSRDAHSRKENSGEMKKRALSLLMSLVMLVSMLPTTAWAADEESAD